MSLDDTAARPLPTHIASLIGLGLCACVIACGDDADADDDNSSGGSTNTGTFVDETPASMSSPLVVTDAQLIGDSEQAVFYAAVRNDGSEILCFIHLDPIRFLDAGGSALATAASFIDGTVRKLPSTNTNTCLGPGEIGEVAEPVDVPAADVASVGYSFDWVESPNEVPDTTVELEGGMVMEVADGDQMRFSGTLVNTGREGALAAIISVRFYVKDSAGNFLDQTFDRDIDEGVLLSPNVPLPFSTFGLDVAPGGAIQLSHYVSWDDPEFE